MTQEQLIGTLTKLEEVISQYEDVIKDESDLVWKECAVIPAEKLREQFEAIAEKGRLLNIGIIGRVKAGKSSLLNSVFFKGESILPKAATPMTASLTVMTHGDDFSARVEYFSAKDIETIHQDHDRYKNLWEIKFREHQKDIADRVEKKGEKLNSSEIEARAKRRTQDDIKDERLIASFEQYKRMVESGKLDEMKGRVESETIEAGELSDLMGQLNRYVGSEGPLMPFTRSVEIRLPMNSLMDIQVVDTPGINDPVASRTERTNEYLRNCDVVFIVSPAGQFISAEDTNLMDQLSSKEGVREIYFVGSQLDNQLYGSPGEDSHWDLDRAIESIRSGLAAHAIEALILLKNNNPEVRDQFDQLIKEGNERIIVTSAICHAMWLRFKEKATWDKDMNHAWGLLVGNYPDYFGSDESAKVNLKKLSGIESVSKKIAEARKAKDRIIAQKQEDYLAGQQKNIAGFMTKLTQAVAEKIDRINNTDLKTIQEEKKKTGKLFSKGSEAIDGTFEDCVDDFRTELRNTVSEKGKTLFSEVKGSVKDSEQTKTKTRHWTTGFLFWKKQHSKNYEVTTVRAGAVKSMLNDLLNDLRENLINSVETAKMEWKKSVQKKVTGALMAAVEDVDLIDISMLKTALRRMVNNMELPDLDLSGLLFGSGSRSYTGTLEGDEAEQFMEEVQMYMAELRTKYAKLTNDFIKTLEKTAKQERMSGLIFADMQKQLEVLEKELGNKKLTLDRLHKCQAVLREV
jgi:tRNA U34 5-carboxymethylaminomethyl modifying GTPase MnmE/TrmE